MSESSSNSSPISARKLRANRRNARKSTGPKSDEGKRVSRDNALTHGMCCSKDFNQAMIPQQSVRALQFDQEGQFERYERLEKLEQCYENGMDKVLRQLEPLRKSKPMNRSEEDEMEQTLLSPYLEEYADITGVLEEERAEERAFVEEIGKDDDGEANEATESEEDDKFSDEDELGEEELQEDDRFTTPEDAQGAEDAENEEPGEVSDESGTA